MSSLPSEIQLTEAFKEKLAITLSTLFEEFGLPPQNIRVDLSIASPVEMPDDRSDDIHEGEKLFAAIPPGVICGCYTGTGPRLGCPPGKYYTCR